MNDNSFNAAPVTEVREPGEDEKANGQFATFDQDGSLESPNGAVINPNLAENSLFLDRSTSQNEHVINNTLTENSFLNAGVSRINNSFQASVLGCGSISQARKIRGAKEKDVKQLHNRIAILQAEEERALKRIEETKKRAQRML